MSPFPLVPRKNTTDEIVVHVPSEDEMKMLSEMFPSVESEAIKSVIEANDGNMERKQLLWTLLTGSCHFRHSYYIFYTWLYCDLSIVSMFWQPN